MLLLLLMGMTFVLGGCGGLRGPGTHNQISSASVDGLTRIEGSFRTAVFRWKDANTVTILLSDIDAADLLEGRFPESGQVVSLDMFWRPRGGATPVDETATNCTVRHVIFSGDAVGVYGGAGFLYPRAAILFPSSESFAGDVMNATMRLLHRSRGFADRLGPAQLKATFSASRDDEALTQMAIQLNTEVSRRLGRIYFVIGD